MTERIQPDNGLVQRLRDKAAWFAGKWSLDDGVRPEYIATVDLLGQAADEIVRLERQVDGFAYVIHAGSCEACNPLNRPNTVCEHGAKLLESARPGATTGMKMLKYD